MVNKTKLGNSQNIKIIMSLQQGTSLHRVSSKDIPALVDIHYEAFADDALMKLMYGSHGDAASAVSDLREALEDPTARFTKAVDNETGDIVGWSWWNVYLDAETHLEAAKTTEEEQKEAPKTAISPETFLQYHAAVNDRRRRWITGKPGSSKWPPSSMPYLIWFNLSI